MTLKSILHTFPECNRAQYISLIAISAHIHYC